MHESGPKQRNRRKMQTVTMTDVARAAQVSPSTVSLFLRRPAEVSERIGARVKRAIDDLGYVPNFVAGGLAAAGSRVVSILVPSLHNSYFSETVTRLESILAPQGLQILIGFTEHSEQREERLVRTSLSWRPAALVITGLSHGPAVRKLLEKTSVPLFQMWETGEAPIGTAIGFDHREIGRASARHLLDRGRRNLAFLGARMDQDTRAGQRCAGFLETVRAAGAEATVLELPVIASAEAGVELMRKVHEIGGIDGVLCSNDTLALGVTFEARRMGVRIPQDMALMGFGAMEYTGVCEPPLTTVRPSVDRIANEIGKRIIDRDGNQDAPDTHGEVIDTGFELIVREST